MAEIMQHTPEPIIQEEIFPQSSISKSNSAVSRSTNPTVYDTVTLDRQQREIRLVELLPASTDDIIRCKFHRVDFQDNPDYVALSYMWGDEKNPKVIELDGKSFTVRKNLWDFLHMFRERINRGDEDALLWIDAICINQENIQERNDQVALMRSIYSSTRFAAVWLGPADESSDLAMTTIANSRQYEKNFWNLPKHQQYAVLMLCQRRYWKRIWIVQEVALPATIRIYCGDDVVEGEIFQELIGGIYAPPQSVVNWYYLRKSWPSGGLSHESHAESIIKIRCGWHESFQKAENGVETPFRGINLYTLLSRTGHMESTDPRDKYYALFSLTDREEAEVLHLKADYSLTTLDLCHQVLEQYYNHKASDGRKLLGFGRVLQESLGNPEGFSADDMFGLFLRKSQKRQTHEV